FGYMVQWWIFALIGLVGYPLILRRVARNRSRGEQVPVDVVPAEEPTGSVFSKEQRDYWLGK
ncbi:MAG TPA: hypothetical protein PKM95_01820, partial [Deltaproteobacteria bacterium]|nr:hypothetical protein [Deltaproteobacteria bacterium]